MEPLLLGKSRGSKPSWRWLQGHPIASAVLYMLLGGGIVYLFFASSSSSSSSSAGGSRSQQQQMMMMINVPAAAAAGEALADPAAAATLPAAAPPTIPAAPINPAICTDTCFKAKDGVCDDGRYLTNMTRHLGSRVLCDLGTDCSDCGPWKGVQHSKHWTEPVGPVEYLRLQRLVMWTRRSMLDLQFYLAYTDPAHDVDFSHNFNGLGTMEARLSHIAYHLLHRPCQKAGNGVMLDVGAGFGWYAVMAGMMGCRVIAWEPVTTLRAFMEYSIARNKVQEQVELRAAAVVQYPSQPGQLNYTVIAPQRGSWGTASIDGKTIDVGVDNQGPYHKFNVSGESLDDALLSTLNVTRVALLKVDVHGYEPYVMAGAVRVLEKRLVDNILMEYSPYTAEHARLMPAEQVPKMLLSLLSSGFKIGHIDGKYHTNRDIVSLSEPLETLPAVTETNLKFDIFDSIQITDVGHTWLKQPCKEMVSFRLIGEGVPERLHPKSFRSSFEVNTNIWATLQPEYWPYVQGSPVGVFPADRKLTDSWFVPEWGDKGMGGRSCKQLREVAASQPDLTARGRASMLISHRCRCGLALPCVEEEAIADHCAQAGTTPFSDDPNFVPDR